MSSIALPPLADPPTTPAGWSLPRRLLFRFGFIYWLLFCMPLLVSLPDIDWLGEQFTSVWNSIAVWVGHHVFGIEGKITTESSGSGDQTVSYVMLFCYAVAALVGTAAWSLVSRRREHERLRELLHVAIRHVLAFMMLYYGVIKLFGGQFPPPSDGRLVQRIGDASPMGLLWTFMGASPAYVMFAGAGETLGGVLLLFRRTTTLAALLLAAVLTNVVAMNFCYDVPVKIHSSHYLAMCIFLILPDLRRLARVLVLNRATEPAPMPTPPRERWVRIAFVVARVALVGYVTWPLVGEVQGTLARRSPSRTWYEGYWKVEALSRSGQDVPALVTDATRWHLLKLEVDDKVGYLRWRNMDDSRGSLYTVAVDEAAHTMVWTPAEAVSDEAKLDGVVTVRFVRPDPDHLRLEFDLAGVPTVVTLARWSAGDMLLMTRGFHWINEVPFNR